MEYQFRRGIYRPNAQRLSISLAPLVAQRSLLFRVKADLYTKSNYSELSPSREDLDSPDLFVVTASASARIMSAALSVALSGALSSCSVYSQESWKGPSPFVHAAPPLPHPVPRAGAGLLQVDTRRHAIAFSPSVQWEAMSAEGSGNGDPIPDPQTPLQSAPLVKAIVTLPKEDVIPNARRDLRLSTSSHLSIPFFMGGIPSPKAIVEPQVPVKLGGQDGGLVTMPKKKDSPANRVSKHAKAFGKAMSHLSMQTTKKDTVKEDAKHLTIASIKHLGPEYKLPSTALRVSPVRASFIAKPSSVLPVALPAPRVRADPSEHDNVQNTNSWQQRPRPPRSIRPTPQARPTTLPAVARLPMPFKKGHKRYNSSPAVANFAFKGWDAGDMPPLPAMPDVFAMATNTLPVRPRAASAATRGHVRAASVPFPNCQSFVQ